MESFILYTQQSNLKDKRKLADANMRIADGAYATRQNESAIKYYLEVLKLKSGYEDQALFFVAKAYSFTESGNGTANQIAHLQDLIANHKESKYVLPAIENLATTYKGIEEYDKAKLYFELIITDYPSNILVKQAKIEVADIYLCFQIPVQQRMFRLWNDKSKATPHSFRFCDCLFVQ